MNSQFRFVIAISRRAVLFAGIVALVLLPGLLRAQISTSSLNGTVQDPSGAVIPGATVILTNVGTNVSRNVTTNGAGVYSFIDVMPGTYNLSVSKEGFETLTKTGIALTVGSVEVVNVTMQVGSPVQKVTVVATLASVQTATSNLGTTVSERQIADLPLNGRNFTELLTLQPGASPLNTSHNAYGWYHYPPGSVSYDVPTLNGQYSRSILFMIDGVYDSNDFDNGWNVAPVIDDLAEMKVQSGTDQAEFGQAMGGVVNIVTKGGTNQFHGAGWDFLRNDILDARNPFSFIEKTPLRRNQFGGNVGGPVIIPKIWNGRNRTFFFGSYEGFRNNTASSMFYVVPTAANLSGDLSQSLPGVPIPQLYNPFTTTYDSATNTYIRQPFQGNQIPQNLINQNSVKLAETFWPAPIYTGVAGSNGEAINPLVYRTDQFTPRIDEQLGAKQSLFFRYTWSHYTNVGAYSNAYDRSANITYDVNWGLNYINTLTPATVLQAQFGHNVFDYYQTISEPVISTSAMAALLPQLWSSDFIGTIPGYGSPTPNMVLPYQYVPGYPGIESRTNYNQWSNNWTAAATLSHVHGKHILKAGYSFITIRMASYGAADRIGYDPSQTDDRQNQGATGYGLASFLLGVPNDSTSAPGSGGGYSRSYTNGFFVQDQWKVLPKLTVNLGLRWDAWTPGTDFGFYGSQKTKSYAGASVLDYDTGVDIMQQQPAACGTYSNTYLPCLPTPGGQLPAHVQVGSLRLFPTVLDNWQPRVGVAYRLSNRLALRAGYGRFYDNWSTNLEYAGPGWPVPGNRTEEGMNTPFVTVSAYPDDLAGSTAGLPPPTPFALDSWNRDPKAKNSYSDQWNMGLEVQVRPTTVAKLLYVGSVAHRLQYGTDDDLAPTPGPGNWESRVPYPYLPVGFFTKYIGNSLYDAFQFSLEKKVSRGYGYLVSYTWSKNLDDPNLFDSSYCQVPWNLKADRSVSNTNLPNMLKGSFIYELPFGPGKQFTTSSRVLNAIIGRWQANGIFTAQSGMPVTVVLPGDVDNIGFTGWPGYMRPNLVGTPYPATKTAGDWLNASAFATPANYTYGNMARNALRGPHLISFDGSLFREHVFKETKRLQFRVEAFNFINSDQLGNPSTTLSSPQFGQIFYTSIPAREIQLSLKFLF